MNQSAGSPSLVLRANALTKVYPRGREQVRALDGVSFAMHSGQFVAIVGPSGAGKSTLLNLVGCMDAPTSGALELMGNAVHNLPERERTRLRRNQIGFVFQHFGLLPTLTVAENVSLPAFFAGRRGGPRVNELLAQVGLEHRRDHRPNELSGGEMQRAAIARALINSPSLLLADEPTGNLDSASGRVIIELFQKLNADGLTIMVVTHNPLLAAVAGRQIQLRDGRLHLDTGAGRTEADSVENAQSVPYAFTP
jgi:putative ABC transport system ATP-binding protein